MADSMLAMIYERLNASSSYKPFSAQTFSDWASEAGDTVTISRDGTSYSAPLHKQTISWNGSQTVNMETTGNETMDSVATQSAEKLTSTSTGYTSSLASYGKFHTFEVNDERLLYEVFNENGQLARLTVEASQIRSELEDSVNSLYSSITQEASQIRSEVHNAESSLYSAITQTESQIRMEVGDVVNSLHSEITQTASSIRLSISGVTDSSGKVTAASIALAINNAGSSVALINADHVKISGNTTINDIFGVNGSGYLTIAGDVYSTGTFNIGGANIASGGSISFITGTAPLSYATISGTEVNEMIIKASVSGNTLQLWKRGDSTSGNPSITFSKATSLSGAWSSGKITVTASPQGETWWELLQAGTPELDGTTYTVPINAVWGSSGQYSESTGWNVTVDASDVWNAGYIDGLPSGISIGTLTNAGTTTPTGTEISALSTGSIWSNFSNTYGYLKFPVTVHGKTKNYYFAFDNRQTTSNGNPAYGAGYGAAKMSGSWNGATLSISKNTTGSTSLSYTVSASASISYNSTTHKYTATAKAACGGADRASSTAIGGTEAYTAGFNASHTIGIYDTNGSAVSSQTISSAIDLWAGMQKSDGSWQWGSKVTITPSGGSCSGDSAGSFVTSASPTNVLAGWNPVYASFSVPNKATGYYRYIKFRVGSAQRSFYFN